MKRDDKVLAVYPPHPEEGASMCASEKRNRCVAPVSKNGAAPWFETPRTRLWNRGRPKIAAPHHEAERDCVCIKLTGIRFSAADLNVGGWALVYDRPTGTWRKRDANCSCLCICSRHAGGDDCQRLVGRRASRRGILQRLPSSDPSCRVTGAAPQRP